MKKFYKTALKSIDSTGMVAASSKFLIKKLMKPIDFTKDLVLVEFGTGDGCVTEEILDKMSEGSVLYSYELHEDFYNHCKVKFSGDSRLRLFNHSALEFSEDLLNDGHKNCDVVISSLPLSFMPNSVKDELLSKVSKSIPPHGNFFQYQYSVLELRRMKKHFDKVKIDFTMLNIPPAFIYRCSVS